MKVYHHPATQDEAADRSSATALTGERLLERQAPREAGEPVPAETASATAPISLRGQGRVFWNVDQVPPDEPWPSGLPHYSGTLVINEIHFRIEGWRAENDAGRHVRLVVTSQPIHEGQWPQKE